MQRNFLTVKNFLEAEFPELRGHIVGGNYPPPPFAIFLMQALSALHLIAVAFVFFGDSLWSFIPLVDRPPQWYRTAKEYPMQTFVILFFVIPTMVQSRITTGAFEITLEDKLLFSRIQTGRFPNGDELIELFQKAGFVR